jgi:arylsulfatase A-like enzyme
MISSYDYFPTILDYLGVPSQRDPKRVGRSYAPLLQGKTLRGENRLFFEYSFVRAVRTENLKYIERTRDWPSELYDLEADPQETKNVIEEPSYRRRAEALRDQLRAFFQRVDAPEIEQWRSSTSQELTVYRR